jgi:hypothetical protein
MVQRRIGPAAGRDVSAPIEIERAKHVLGRQSVDVIVVSH